MEIVPSEKDAFLERLVDVFSKAGHPYVLCLSPFHLLTRFALRAENKLGHVRSLDPRRR